MKDGKLYVGWTDNLSQRAVDHNKGRVDATKSRIPLQLIYFEACISKKSAIAREKVLKTGFGRLYLKKRLEFESN